LSIFSASLLTCPKSLLIRDNDCVERKFYAEAYLCNYAADSSWKIYDGA
jgi:hypothetical protein